LETPKRMNVGNVLRAHVPGLRIDRIVAIDSGWDSVVYEVDGRWIFRFPRRAEVVERLRVEGALLPELASVLPIAVPVFEVAVFDDVNFVGYRKLSGVPLRHGTDEPELGRSLGAFLAALHRFPLERARKLGVRDGSAEEWFERQRRFLETLEERVVPLLEAGDQVRAQGLFADLFRSGRAFEPALLHADLGPEHVLHRGRSVTGVIDWSDTRIGDPALDFAWLLHGTGARFSDALLAAYGTGAGKLGDRARFYHRLGPWHEVLYGLDENRPELVASGLDGIRARLP
jgi:aminoglycoside phosphotransferase (APT) family kinase protein